MVTKRQILKYYRSKKFKPEIPVDSRRRHYRGRKKEGYRSIWKKKLNSVWMAEQLKKWVVEEELLDVYRSTSTWLNPRRVAKLSLDGSGYVIADNLILDFDLYFDIDAESYSVESLEWARKETLKVTSRMKKFGKLYELDEIVFSGCKGFGVSYKNKVRLPKDQSKRAETVKNRKLYILKHLKGVKFDRDVLTNVLAVRGVTGTVNSKTGYIRTRMPLKLLKKPIKTILRRIRYVTLKRPVTPKRADDKTHPNKTTSAEQRPGLSSLRKPFEIVISNRCGKNFIPVITFKKEETHRWRRKKLQETYNTGTLWIITQPNGYKAIISLKVFQKERIQKMMKVCKSKNLSAFKKYGEAWLTIKKKGRYVKLVGRYWKKTKSFLSKEHFTALNPMLKEQLTLCKFHKPHKLRMRVVTRKKTPTV